MPKCNPKFFGEIVDSYRKEDALKMKDRLMNFLPELHPGDRAISETWCRHFTDLDIPWIITRHYRPFVRPDGGDGRVKIYTLWKERVA